MTSKNVLDFDGDQDHFALGLGLGLQLPWQTFTPSECSCLLYKVR